MDLSVESGFAFSLNNIINFIIVEYFSTLAVICIVTSNQGFKFEVSNFNVYVFEYDESTNATRTLFQKGIEEGCQGFIISDVVFSTFLDDFFHVHDGCIQVYKEKRLIVYQSVENQKLLEKYEKLSASLALQDLPGILFIDFDASEKTFSFSTTKYSGPNNDSSDLMSLLELRIGDNYEEILKTVDLFPDKMSNLQGREIVLALFNYMPYVLWREVDESDPDFNSREKLSRTPLHIDGTESWVFLEFCKKLNCSLLISLDEEGEWGEIHDDQTGNGILGAVAEKRAEIGVGALYSWYHESIFLSLSKHISRTGITCITPKPKLLDPIETVILPFSTSLWLAVFISYFLCIFFYKIIRTTQLFIEGDSNSTKVNDETISEVFLNMLGIYVLQSVTISLKRVAILFFLGCVLIVGMMIGNCYSSALASVLTVPRYEKAIDTVEELAESNMEWGMVGFMNNYMFLIAQNLGSTHDAWIFSIQLATQPMILALLDKFKTATKDILEQRAIKQDLSFSIERLPYGHYAIGEYITESTVNNYQTMLNDIYYELCVAMSTKTWPLLNRLDDLILQILESGVQQYVELTVNMENSNTKIQAAVRHSRHRDSTGPIKLTPAHIIGPFILLGGGLIISAGVFIGEKAFNYYRQRNLMRRVIRVWE